MVKVYGYKGCGSCKKAWKFLDSQKIPYEKIEIIENPPSKAELKRMAGYVEGGARKLFNVSGQVYREMGLKDKLKDMKDSEMLALLASHGKLIKRPFLLGDSFGTVGFKEENWQELFS